MSKKGCLADPEWERRSYARMPLSAWMMFDYDHHSRVALTVDVSLGGIAARGIRGVRRGLLVDIWLLLPNAMEIECDAEIVNFDAGRTGFRFVSMSADAADRLATLLYPDEKSGVRDLVLPFKQDRWDRG